jgi:hypothetical protein
MEWLLWLFLSFLAWILGYLILKSPILALFSAGFLPIFLTLFGKVFSVLINNSLTLIVFAVSAIFLSGVFFLKPGVAKTFLSTLLIPVFVSFGIGLILNAYLRMIP